MRLLIDTNVFLEVFLNQEQAEAARSLLSMVGEHDMFLSDFSPHTIGVVLFRKRLYRMFQDFVQDTIGRAGFGVLSLPVNEVERAARAAERFRLDFDDAYQYAVDEVHDLTIIRLDSDFDRTIRGRMVPAQLL
jgi:predicted nucleic acid-binding protein